MTKRKKLDWYNPGPVETETLILAMHKSKVSYTDMLAQLKFVKRTRQVEWTVSAIKEVIKRAEKPVVEEKLKIEVKPHWRDQGDEYDDTLKVELTWETMVTRMRAALKYMAERRAEEERPVDWRRSEAWLKKGIHLVDLYQRIGLAGEDTWARNILQPFVQQTLNTGKNVLDLLDAIKGHGAERAQVKRIIFGIYAQLGRELETTAALRLEIQRLKDKYEPTGLRQPPVDPNDVPRLEPPLTTEEWVATAKRAEMMVRRDELREWAEGKDRKRWWQD